jgi:hypothetical protein
VETIFVFPEKPSYRSILWKISKLLGLRVTSRREEPHRVAILWQDSTYVDEPSRRLASALPERVINGGLHDISKRTLGAHFAKVFGYDLTVDPTTFHGRCVMKSDLNATHDGRVIDCPVPKLEQGVVYQRLIDNRCEPDMVVDLRVPVLNQQIPFVYMKYRPVSSRFSNTNSRVELRESHELFSTAELEQIRALARAMSVDVGEFDVLRDADSQRLYVVDINKTPWGPPNHLPFRDQVRAMRMLSAAFEREFLRAVEQTSPGAQRSSAVRA